MFESIAAFWAEYGNVLTDGVWDTLVMVVISTAFAYLIGLPLGVALILTQPHGIRPHRGVYRVLDWIVNIGRSVPFIILMVAIMPFTRMVVGTTIGVKGAIVPLVVSAAPFIARMVETSLNEVDAGVVEAAQSMGASTLQIVWKVYLPEAKPSLILGGRHLSGDDSGLYRHRWHRGRRRPGRHRRPVRPSAGHHLRYVGDGGVPDYPGAGGPADFQLAVPAHR